LMANEIRTVIASQPVGDLPFASKSMKFVTRHPSGSGLDHDPRRRNFTDVNPTRYPEIGSRPWLKNGSPAAIALLALAAFFLVPSLQGALITGSLGFAGGVSLNNPPGLALFAGGWESAVVNSRSGTFLQIPTGTSMQKFPSLWYFNTSTPKTNFWNILGFVFEITSSHVESQGGTPGVNSYADVDGTGVITGNGYTPTACAWTFSVKDPAQGSAWPYTMTVTSLNSNGAPILVISNPGAPLTLQWPDPTFTLQVAATPGGPYTNVPGATSPCTNNAGLAGPPSQFFRLKQ